MTDHTQAQSFWNMTETQWREVSNKLDKVHITASDFDRFKEKAENINVRIRAFDNTCNEETLRIIVD